MTKLLVERVDRWVSFEKKKHNAWGIFQSLLPLFCRVQSCRLQRVFNILISQQGIVAKIHDSIHANPNFGMRMFNFRRSFWGNAELHLKRRKVDTNTSRKIYDFFPTFSKPGETKEW